MLYKRAQKHFLIFAMVMVLVAVGLVFVSTAMAQVTTGAEEVGAAAGFETATDLRVIIGRIIKIFLGFLGVIAICIVLYAGFLYMTSGGNQEKVETAKKWMINGAIGLALIFSAYAITTFIFNKLSEATGTGQVSEDTSTLDGYFPVGSSSTFIVKAVAPQGAGAPLNTVVKIAFSKPVNPATITDKNIQVVDDATGSAVAGKLAVYGDKKDKVKFTPSAACPDEACGKEGCFDKNKKYKITLKAGAIKSNTGSFGLSCALGSKCAASFTTGEKCDAAAPSVYFTEPIDGGKVSQNKLIDVSIKADDDAGVAGLDFSVDGALFGHEEPEGEVTPLTFGAYFAWDTEGVKTGVHTLKASAEDVNDHTSTKEIKVSVLPEYCFDALGNPQCNAEHPDCGACDGKTCTKNEDCAGLCIKSCDKDKNKACKEDVDCGAGAKCVGVCVTEPIITDMMPKTAGPGSLVTITGAGFLNFQSGDKKGQVYFSGKDDKGNLTYIKAELGCASNSAWNNNQIIAKVPAKAVTGPIKVENHLAKFDTTDDKDGWDGDFVFSAKDVYPGLCAVEKENCTPSCVDNVCKLCNMAAMSEKVKATGNNFGAKDDDDLVFFGQIPAGFGTGFSWKADSVSGLEVPVIKSGKSNVALSKGKKCANTETGEVCVPKEEDKKCVCKDIYSNPVAFTVLPMENLPKIDSAAPLPTKIGQMLTIKGLNFGVAVGHVEIAREIAGQPYEWAVGLGCGPEAWSENEIIVKIPTAIAEKVAEIAKTEVGTSVFSKDYKLIVYNAAGISSVPLQFEIVEGEPGPGICSLTPNNGPVSIAVDLNGEYFGDEKKYDIKFSAAGGDKITCPDGVKLCDPDKDEKCACTKKADEGVTVKSVGDWAIAKKTLIDNAVVPVGAVSGDVYLISKDGKVKSNSVKFKVGSCTQNSCAKGLTCCDSGSCEAKCKEAVVYQPAEYMWIMSTGPLPKMLQVLERPCVVGLIPQSPSPYKATTDACPNGKISATFNMPLAEQITDVPELLYNNIEIRRCKDKGKECDFTKCAAKDSDTCIYRTFKKIANNDVYPANLYISCTLGGTEVASCNPAKDTGCTCVLVGGNTTAFGLVDSYDDESNAAMVASDVSQGVVKKIELANGAAQYNLFEDTWYEMTLKGGPAGVRTKLVGKFLPADYVWKFKTKKDICVPDNLLMTPLVGLIKELYGPDSEQKYIVSGQYQCQEIPLQGENWQWKDLEPPAPSPNKVTFAGYACAVSTKTAYICPVEKSDRPDIGYFKTTAIEGDPVKINYETLPGAPIEIEAKAEPKDAALKKVFDTLYKKGFLEIRFSEPKVVDFFPQCQEACINTNIFATFNTQMDEYSFTPDTVKLFSCTSADCAQMQPVPVTLNDLKYQYQLNEAFDTTQNKIVLSFKDGTELSPNKFYRVVLTNGIMSYSQVKLAGLNYATVNAPKGDCADAVDDDGDGAIDFTGGYVNKDVKDKQLNYICGCYDRQKKQFISHGQLAAADKCEKSEHIMFACQDLKAGLGASDSPEVVKAIIDTATYVEPDAQCSSPAGFEGGASVAFDAFSWIFKTKNDPEKCLPDRVETLPVKYISSAMGEKIEYTATPFSKPDNCSAKGQPLNAFGYNWTWESSQPAVASISIATTAAAAKPFCSDSCLSKGSTAFATVCGNGEVEDGEECDDKNVVDGDGCSSKCLREPVKSCSAAELQASDKSECCGNGQVEKDKGEECDAGCEYKNKQGAACDPSVNTKDCVCVSKEKVCTSGCQNAGTGAGFACGNDVVEAGEDGDYGKENKNWGLNDKCLNIGATYKSTDAAAAAICGNGKIEGGEECESICKLPNGTICSGKEKDCVCSIYQNPLCTDKCLWKGFPSCAAGCSKKVDCVSGDLGCVGKKKESCNSGADCFGQQLLTCDGANAEKYGCALGGKIPSKCVLGSSPDCSGQKLLTCDNDDAVKMYGCKLGEKFWYACSLGSSPDCLGEREASCYKGEKYKDALGVEHDCKGEKNYDCSQCVNGVMTIDVGCPANDMTCLNTTKKEMSCEACEDGILTLGCQVGDKDCVDNKKSQSCSPKEADCECSGCCGNGIPEKYPGGKYYGINNLLDGFDEECEADCKDKTTLNGCTFGTADCVCTFPEGCSNKCVNLGSSINYDSYCGDGKPELGEDRVCECVDAACLPGNNTKIGPSQVAVTISELDKFLSKNAEDDYIFSYNIVTKYIQGATDIMAALVDNAKKISGVGNLQFKTNDPAIVDMFKDILPKTMDDGFGGTEGEVKACDAIAEIDGKTCVPQKGATGVCTNALIYLPLTAKVDTKNMVVKLTENTPGGNCVAAAEQGGRWWAFKNTIRDLFVKVGWAAPFCSVDSSFSVIKDQAGNPVIKLAPKAAMKPNTKYEVLIDGLATNCAETVPPLTLSFTTGNGICLLDSVSLTPSNVLITKANTTTDFSATAKSGSQMIAELPGVYEWQWQWSVGNKAIANPPKPCLWDANGQCVAAPTVPEQELSGAMVTNLATNGSTIVTAEAVISVDATGMTGPATSKGAKVPGVAQFVVFLCDHLWNPADTTDWETLKSEINFGQYQTTYKMQTQYNIGLFYCRDFGEAGTFDDDLPKVDIALTDVINKDITPRFGIYFDKSFDYVQVKEEALNNSFADPKQAWSVDTWLYNQNMPDDRYARVFYKNLAPHQENSGKHVQLAIRKWGLNCKKGGQACVWSYDGGIINQNGCDTCDFRRSLILRLNNGLVDITKGTEADVGLLENGFNHVAVAYTANKDNPVNLYVNGKKAKLFDVDPAVKLYVWPKDGNESIKDSTDYPALYIGGEGKTSVPLLSFDGYIDEFRIWSKPLDKEAVETLVKTKNFDPKNRPELLGYWNFDTNTDDSSPNELYSTANCTINYNESKCDLDSKTGEKKFYHVNLTDLAIMNDLLTPDQAVGAGWQDLSGNLKHQCDDKIDNDGNGLADEKDPKCSSASDAWEEPKLFTQYFFTRLDDDDPANDHSGDVISLRVYENIEALPPDVWYERYAPNPGQTTPVALDCQEDQFGKFCYNGAKDGTTVYAAASNVAFGKDDVPPHNIYSNIYVLGFNSGANAATQNIFTQMVNMMWFNTNLLTKNSGLEKVKLIRDTQRIQDMVMLNDYLKEYKVTPPHNGAVPQIDAGSYVRGRTFSVWPSWQKEFGAALKKKLPTDPLNHYYWEGTVKNSAGVGCADSEVLEPAYCPVPKPGEGSANNYQCVIPGKFCVKCPAGYDPTTCYNSTTLEISNIYDKDQGKHPVYSFWADPDNTGNKSSYKLNFMFEIADPYVYKVSPAFGAEVEPWQVAPVTPLAGPVPECMDGEDNDGDGKVDFPNDPGCKIADGPSEDNTYECNDGKDNDEDGKKDFSDDDKLGDPGCTSEFDNSEAYPAECNDGKDNDGDKTKQGVPAIDMQDVGCVANGDNNEAVRGMPVGNILVAFFVDTSMSMGDKGVGADYSIPLPVDAPPYVKGNDPTMQHKDIIKKIINGVEDGDKHIDGLNDVFGDKASYVLGTSHPVADPAYNVGPNQSTTGLVYTVGSKIGYPPKQKAQFIDWLDNTPYPYITVVGMPTYINNSLNDALDVYKGGDFAGLIYIIITDADDTSPVEAQNNTISTVNQYKIPLHFFYIRASALEPTSPKYIFYRNYHDLVDSHWRGVWEQGTVAGIKDKLKDIIGEIGASAEIITEEPPSF